MRSWGEVTFANRLSGGSTSNVYYVRFSQGPEAVFKYDPTAPPHFFSAEQHGLALLTTCRALRVPTVYAVQQQGMLMQWFADDNAAARQSQAQRLGELLARQHRIEGDHYGLNANNYIGSLPQNNTPTQGWVDFYRDYRLQPQFAQAIASRSIPEDERRSVFRLLERLQDWLDEEHIRPSLLHGDLWSGNWLATSEGPAVIDPAVYYGHREVDIAMA